MLILSCEKSPTLFFLFLPCCVIFHVAKQKDRTGKPPILLRDVMCLSETVGTHCSLTFDHTGELDKPTSKDQTKTC